MKRFFHSFLFIVIAVYILGVTVYAGDENPEMEGRVYNGYDFTYDPSYSGYISCGGIRRCWTFYLDGNGLYCLYSLPFDEYDEHLLYGKIKVPDSINGKEIRYIEQSSNLGEFDLNPENPYMKYVDNVVFSSDEKNLMSYAVFDKRTKYAIPEGTEIIECAAFFNCRNLRKVVMPHSVKTINSNAFSCAYNVVSYDFSDNVSVIPEHCFVSNKQLLELNISEKSKLSEIREMAFSGCPKLRELCLPSFEIKIDKEAFGYGKIPKTKLKSYAYTKVVADKSNIKWDEIPNASYYEIYQKLSSGEYKLLGKTKKTAYTFNSLKSGREYTFAVKPVAVIPATNYDKERDSSYPETFTIEGTMSEDVVVKG